MLPGAFQLIPLWQVRLRSARTAVSKSLVGLLESSALAMEVWKIIAEMFLNREIRCHE